MHVLHIGEPVACAVTVNASDAPTRPSTCFSRASSNPMMISGPARMTGTALISFARRNSTASSSTERSRSSNRTPRADSKEAIVAQLNQPGCVYRWMSIRPRSVGPMSSTKWGIGVPGALGPDAIGNLAALAEECSYQSFWFNCVAPHADPAALLDAALGRTDRIEVGVGVIPLDGYPAATLAARLHGGRADDPRVVLGVGSGGTRRGALQRVSDGI